MWLLAQRSRPTSGLKLYGSLSRPEQELQSEEISFLLILLGKCVQLEMNDKYKYDNACHKGNRHAQLFLLNHLLKRFVQFCSVWQWTAAGECLVYVFVKSVNHTICTFENVYSFLLEWILSDKCIYRNKYRTCDRLVCQQWPDSNCQHAGDLLSIHIMNADKCSVVWEQNITTLPSDSY